MNKKIIIILFFCFIIILAWIIYYFIPRYNAGYLNNIGELEDKYPLCHITNLKSKGRLIFIEKRQWSSWTIVVFGKFDDDINIFKDDRRGRNIRKFNSISSFFIYSYAYGYKDASFPDGLKLPIRNVTTSDSEYGYRFIDMAGHCVQETILVEGYINSTSFSISVDPVSKNFVLNLEIMR